MSNLSLSVPSPPNATPPQLLQNRSESSVCNSVDRSDDTLFTSPNQPTEHPLTSAERWDITLDRAIKGIVCIKAATLRPFDTVSSGSYNATGFVVDAAQGIILSNRHVVNPGPTTSTAVFWNYEEVTLKSIYYDPVHDFGFFKYDPSKIRFAKIEEIELYPQGARVGLDIRVCGNDAGEKLSILGSTLARLDRAAPHYGRGIYNDFNTFYYQAASGTSGGSSGSPVLDIHGRAIALNAGGKKAAASSFYLPLDRVVRALKLIQLEKPISRGTLQTTFGHLSYDELKRLGLPPEIERQCRERNSDGTGLLSINNILPDGPGSKAGLEVSDILLECYQERFGRLFIDNFYSLWEVIDESVGKEVELTFYRGKTRLVVNVTVQDLHSITPRSFFEAGRAVFHTLSYQLARSYHRPCRGVFVARSGKFDSSGDLKNCIVTHLDGHKVDSLEAFIEIALSIRDGKRVALQYFKLGEYEDKFKILETDHHFFGIGLFTRFEGTWERKVLTPNPIIGEEVVKPVTEFTLEETWQEKLRKNMVMVRCGFPYHVRVCHS
jgi:pro-apoptotic serine protease NMA111